jgi:hypothetical protein
MFSQKHVLNCHLLLLPQSARLPNADLVRDAAIYLKLSKNGQVTAMKAQALEGLFKHYLAYSLDYATATRKQVPALLLRGNCQAGTAVLGMQLPA